MTVFNGEVVFLQFFKPSGQLSLWLLEIPEPLEGAMVCTEGKLVTKEVWSEVLDEVYHSQQLTSCHAVLAFRLAQGSAGICNYALCAVVLYLR